MQASSIFNSNNHYQAFNNALQALKEFDQREIKEIRKAKLLLFESANEIIKTDSKQNIFEVYSHHLQKRSKKEIKVIVDEKIDAAARFEFAENHDRSYHLIKYNPKFPAACHLMMHELVHLEFALEAREKSSNRLFIGSEANRKLFIDSFRNHSQILQKQGYPKDTIDEFYISLFSKISGLAYNTPIDLFIEDKLFNEYPDLRPLQLLSLSAIISGGIKESTEKTLFIQTPQLFNQSFRVLNMVFAMHFRELYGVNLISDFKPSHTENTTATRFYEEFKEYRYDREAGEEYELVENWVKDLKLDKYLKFVDEIEYRQKKYV